MPRPRSDIQPRILRAARERFLVDGVDGASLRRIAREARTNIGMIYYYFPTKEDLFLAVVEEAYGSLVADLAAALAPGSAIDERLRRLFTRLGSMSDDEHATVRLIVREAMVSAARRRRVLDRFLRGHVPLLLALIHEGVHTGALTSRQPPVVLAIATGVLAVFPQVVRRLAASDIPPELGLPSGEFLALALADTLLHGMGTGSQRLTR